MKCRVLRNVAMGVASVLPLSVACSDSVDIGPANGINVSVIAAPANDAPGGTGAVSAITIDGVRLVVGGVKLETAGVDGTVDWELIESRVIEVDLSGDPVTAHSSLDVPTGTYKEVEISIDKLEPGNPDEDGLIDEHPDLADASIVINGRRELQDGSEEAFTFAAALDRDMEIQLTPLLVLADGDEPTGVRVTVLLDTSGWFRSQAGSWLDPNDAADRSAIEGSLQASFEAFEDGDLDGAPGPIVR